MGTMTENQNPTPRPDPHCPCWECALLTVLRMTPEERAELRRAGLQVLDRLETALSPASPPPTTAKR